MVKDVDEPAIWAADGAKEWATGRTALFCMNILWDGIGRMTFYEQF